MKFYLSCPECDGDIDAEVVIDSTGSPGHYGLPEDSYPGEGAEWHLEEDVVCADCGRVWGDDEFSARFEERIQEGIEESMYDNYE